MHPDTRDVAKHMREFGITVLGRAAYQCTFSEMGAPYAHAMAVGHAAHGAELILKARIADEHPLLIFSDLPKSKTTTTLLSINELFEKGRTLQYSELPEKLWATTGIRIDGLEQYQRFGHYRNTIMHFAVPDRDWSEVTLKFLFEVIEPLLDAFWGESMMPAAGDWDEVTVSEGHLEQQFEQHCIEITPLLRANLDKENPNHYKQ